MAHPNTGNDTAPAPSPRPAPRLPKPHHARGLSPTIASWIVQSVSIDGQKHDAVTAAHIEDLRGDIAQLRELLRAKVSNTTDAG